MKKMFVSLLCCLALSNITIVSAGITPSTANLSDEEKVTKLLEDIDQLNKVIEIKKSEIKQLNGENKPDTGVVFEETEKVNAIRENFDNIYKIDDYPNAIKPGKYKVGVNIEPGEYRIYSSAKSSYFAITADSNGDDILNNDIFEDISYINVREGEYLELNRCFIVPFNPEEPKDDTRTIFNGGIYKVGFDIEPGEYYLEVETEGKNGYWSILNSSYSDQDIVSNEIYENQTFVTVEDGQYLELNRSILDLDNQ